MTDQNYTHILAIVDRSGSMNRIKSDMEGALNAYFEEQGNLDGKCLVDYVQFDDQYEVVYKGKRASQAKAVIEPRGMTALLDAIGKASTDFGAKLRKMREADRPGKVQVVVVTDGLENRSQEWTRDAVKELIDRQESKYDWDFVFLGTGFDAVSVGTSYGFQAGKTLTFNPERADQLAASLNAYTTNYRTAGASAANFSDSDRANNS